MQSTRQNIKSLGRLLCRDDFLRAQQQGKKWVSKSVIVEVASNEKCAGVTSGLIRYGLTVSKRVSKSAVVRNRIRRRLRSAACDVLPLYAKPGFDYVLVGRPDTATRSYMQIKEDVRWCLEKLACLREVP